MKNHEYKIVITENTGETGIYFEMAIDEKQAIEKILSNPYRYKGIATNSLTINCKKIEINKVEIGTHTCGHIGSSTNAMGKGKARQKKIASYLDRPCLDCVITKITDRILGMLRQNGTRASDQWYTDKIESEITKIELRY